MTRFPVTIVAKAKHGVLYDLAMSIGGIGVLATELGVSEGTLSGWINLRTMPKLRTRGRGSRKRNEAIALHLCQLTGKRIEEIFPDFVRERLPNIPRQIEAKQEIGMVGLAQSNQERLTLPDPAKVAEEKDAREVSKKMLLEALSLLTYREREVIKLRFGLGEDGMEYTLEEVASAFRVSQERTRQIEGKAIRKLQGVVPLYLVVREGEEP